MSMNTGTIFHKVNRWTRHPLAVTMCIILGGFTGYFFPETGKGIGFISVLYIGLLKMIVLPFMLSAVVFSLRSIFVKSKDVGNLIQNIFKWFSASLVVVAIIGLSSALLIEPGAKLNDATLEALGGMIQTDKKTTTDMEISMSEVVTETHSEPVLERIIKQLIPTNIFSALGNGETIKVLVFAIFLGLAIGRVPANLSDTIAYSLQSIFIACQRLTHWFNFMLPIASFSMAAQQIATVGLEPMLLMIKFIAVLLVATIAVTGISIFAIWRKTGLPFSQVLASQQDSFFMAVSTSNSTACMPNMMESLFCRLHLKKEEVELVVPLGISLLRLGPVVYYTIATIFIAQLYGKVLTPGELMLLFVVCILTGISATGMTGIVTVAQTSVVCSFLGLPFEAAFVLFVAVDPIADMMRTVILVSGVNGASALICSREQTTEHHGLRNAASANA